MLIFIAHRSKINLSSFSLVLRVGVCGALLELRVCRPHRQQYAGLAGPNPWFGALQQQFIVVVVNGQQPGLTFQTVSSRQQHGGETIDGLKLLRQRVCRSFIVAGLLYF